MKKSRVLIIQMLVCLLLTAITSQAAEQKKTQRR